MNRNYVGITGITTLDEVLAVIDLYKKNGFNENFSHQPLLSFLVSDDSMKRKDEQISARYPIFAQLNDMLRLCRQEGVDSCIAFNSKELGKIYDNIGHLIDRYELPFKMLQLQAIDKEINPKHLEQVGRIVDRYGKNIETSISISRAAITGKIDSILDKVKAYRALGTERFLFDYTSGKEGCIPAQDFVDLYHRTANRFFHIACGVAGNLTPDNVGDCLKPINDNLFGDYSIDVLRGVRDQLEGEGQGNDKLNLEKADKFISNAYFALTWE